MKVKYIEFNDYIHTDDRGWRIDPAAIADITGKSIGDIHFVSLKPCMIRGNHYHTNTTEWTILCKCPALFA